MPTREKMNKFKKWLIKKLGGYTEQTHYEPLKIIYKTYNLVPITAIVEVSDFDRDALELPREVTERNIKKELKHKLMENIVPEYKRYRNIERNSTIYRAKIYVSSGEGVKNEKK